MQNDVGAARRVGDGGMIERVNLDDLGAAGRARRGARPHQAGDRPAGIAERFRRPVAEPPGRAEDQDARLMIACNRGEEAWIVADDQPTVSCALQPLISGIGADEQRSGEAKAAFVCGLTDEHKAIVRAAPAISNPADVNARGAIFRE